MLSIHADGENRHRLEDSFGTEIGWIHGRAIGFAGMRTLRDAVHAAATGSRAFQAALRRQYPGWPQHEPTFDELRVVNDGAYDWISDGKVPLARLLRLKGEDARHGPFGLEFVLPSFASEGVAVVVAQSLGCALQAHLHPAPPTTFVDEAEARPTSLSA